MRKALLLFVVMISMVLVSTTSFAAPWTVPTNMRVVQKQASQDTSGRVYISIQAALASIPTSGSSSPSATNPYLVKVMAGEYKEAFTLRPYISLEGSGQDATIISFANVDPTENCAVGTVRMSNFSAIRNVTIKNIPTSVHTYSEANALVFNDAKAIAENVNIVVGSDTILTDLRTNGVCSSGVLAHATLNNMNIEAHNNGAHANPIKLTNEGSLTLTNSKLAGFNNNGGMVHAISTCCGGSTPGTIYVSDIAFEGTSPSVQALFVQGFTAKTRTLHL